MAAKIPPRFPGFDVAGVPAMLSGEHNPGGGGVKNYPTGIDVVGAFEVLDFAQPL